MNGVALQARNWRLSQRRHVPVKFEQSDDLLRSLMKLPRSGIPFLETSSTLYEWHVKSLLLALDLQGHRLKARAFL